MSSFKTVRSIRCVERVGGTAIQDMTTVKVLALHFEGQRGEFSFSKSENVITGEQQMELIERYNIVDLTYLHNVLSVTLHIFKTVVFQCDTTILIFFCTRKRHDV